MLELRRKRLVKNPKTGVLLALLFAASMWFYIDRILVPYQAGDAVAHDVPRGNLSDLYPRWLGARELLLHGRDPYSPEVTREIQIGYYGRVLDPSRRNEPEDQQGFVYPVYVALLLAPTVRLPFPVVQRSFNYLLWLLTGVSVPLWLRALHWRPSRYVIAIFVILALGSMPVAQGIKLQQISLLVAGLLAGCASALACGYLAVAGVLLGLSTVKPQLACLPVLWLLVWAFHDWRARRRLVWSFAATALALLAGAQIVLPGWMGKFIAAVERYHQYTHNTSVLSSMFAPTIGHILAIILVLVTAILCRPLLKEPQGSPSSGLALSLVLALTVLIVPMFAPYNQVLLLPAVMLLVRDVPRLPSARTSTRVVYAATGVLLFWPWVASAGLTVSAFVLPPEAVQSAWRLPFFTTFNLPLFVFGTLALFSAKMSRAQAPVAAGPV
jgi:hypothetical protein